MKIVVGTRGSKLALAQTNWVIDQLKKHDSSIIFEVKVIQTKGDLIQHVALDKIGDKGVFVQEIERQLQTGVIDLAVHSMKDMPSQVTKGLCFAMTPTREDRRDVLVLRSVIDTLADLPQGAVIATGSKRRKYQLLRLRPDLKIVPIRGNIDTRMRKLYEEPLDGIVLAAAGLKRIGQEAAIGYYLSESEVMPAPGQGALALQIRQEDSSLQKFLNEMANDKDHLVVAAERGFLSGVNGSCHMPIGAYGVLEGERLCLYGLLGDEEGCHLVEESLEGNVVTEDEAVMLGIELARKVQEALAVYEG